MAAAQRGEAGVPATDFCVGSVLPAFARARASGDGLLAMGFWQCLQPSSGSAIRPPAKDVGVWLSLVEHLVRDEGVAGSNPATPTRTYQLNQ